MSTLPIVHIEQDPSDDKPHIAGRPFSVQFIANLHNSGWTADDIVDDFDLTPGQVYAALSYYYDHRDDIDRAIEATRNLVREVGTPADELVRRIKERQSANNK
jgi:uncharacterized protein (DUF433 family)